MKPHPLFPFIQLVRRYDHEPDLATRTDHVVGPDDWLAFYPDGTALALGSFPSEQHALEGSARDLFEERLDLVELHIAKAKECLDVDLLIRLVEGRARAEARKAARQEFSTAVIAAGDALGYAADTLKRFRHPG